jgi:hypothetical protein
MKKTVLMALAVLFASSAFAGEGAQIVKMKVGQYKMQVLNPNLKGQDGRQSGALTIVLCAPRIEDLSNDSKVAQMIKDAAYPIILSAGSQVILRQDTSYQFGDGSNASSLEPVVLLTCEN